MGLVEARLELLFMAAVVGNLLWIACETFLLRKRIEKEFGKEGGENA